MCPHTWSHIKISQAKRVEADKNKTHNISKPTFHSTAYQSVPWNSVFLLLWNLSGSFSRLCYINSVSVSYIYGYGSSSYLNLIQVS